MSLPADRACGFHAARCVCRRRRDLYAKGDMNGMDVLYRLIPGAICEEVEEGMRISLPGAFPGCFLLRKEERGGAVSRVVRRLQEEWTNEATLEAFFVSEGTSPDGGGVALLLKEMSGSGILVARVAEKSAPLFSVLPAPGTEAFLPLDEGRESACLSRFALLRNASEGLLLESPLSPHRIVVHDPFLAGLLSRLCGDGEQRLSCDGPEAQVAFLSLLRRLGFVERGEGGTVPEALPMPFWEFQDLLFFSRTTPGRGTAYVGKRVKTPEGLSFPSALRAPVSKECVPLPLPSEEALRLLARPFGDVLEARRSRRTFRQDPLPLALFGAFLHAAARVRTIEKDMSLAERLALARRDDNGNGGNVEVPGPEDLALRPFPSGGGLHPLELYLTVRRVEGLPPGTYRYDPAGHLLERIIGDRNAAERLLAENPYVFPGTPEAAADLPTPQVTLYIAARIGRTAWKYEGAVFRLILQDLGCLCQTLCLTAEALSLASCIVGAVFEPLISRAFGTDWREEPFVGAVTLGLPGETGL